MNNRYIVYLLGKVMVVEAVMLLFSCVVSIVYKESVLFTYLLLAIITGVIGFIISRKKATTERLYAKEGFVSVALCWIVLSVIGAIPFYLTKEIPNYIDALFEVVSGFTTTGSSILPEVEALSKTSLFWRSSTHFVGGMGVLVLVLTFVPSNASAMHIMKAESPGPSVGKFVSKLSKTARILYLMYASLTALECLILCLLKMPFYDSINIAFETAGTGGFSIYNSGMAGLPMPVLMTVAIFMVLFGINFNVYYFILIRHAKEAFKCEEMRIYLGIIAVSVILIALNINNTYQNLVFSFETAFFQVASIITTTGFASINFDTWPTLSKTILVLLMFCGACAGSTGGGIKVSRIAIMFKDSINSLRSVVHPRTVKPVRFENKKVDNETLNSIRNYICIYIFVFVASLLIISIDKFDFTTNFTAVTATINNIGPGLNSVGPMCNFSGYSVLSKLVLIFDMLAGRLELLPMLLLFSPFTYRNTSNV